MALDEETVATAKRVWQLNTMMDVPVLDACDLEELDKNAYYRAKRAHEDEWEADRYFPADVMERVESVEETMERVERTLEPTEVGLQQTQSDVASVEERVDAVEERVDAVEARLNRFMQSVPEERQADLAAALDGYVTEQHIIDLTKGLLGAMDIRFGDRVEALEERLAALDGLEERIAQLEEDSEQNGLFG